RVEIVLAPRHAGEELPLGGGVLGDFLRREGFSCHVVEAINRWDGLGALIQGEPTLALCFGPAWIFTEAVIAAFPLGMINFNGIPLPRYLGGAHYTWQILNGDRSGGCFLQEITVEVDRGPILRSHRYLLPVGVRLPRDYFRGNHEEAVRFLDRAIADMVADLPFEPLPYASLDPFRLYFPRLLTRENGYIDWDWSGEEIERFCAAFDDPYPGAMTFLEGQVVHLREVRLERCEGATHPFVAGLVLRRDAAGAWIGVRGGILVVGAAHEEEGADLLPGFREGRRLHTPAEWLERARAFRPVLDGAGVRIRG
ncbi:MAG: hypothetical protein HQL57_02900, partial [Magnetococcales bacterium]|nr:hypothetical protein [Magnetococcales bacterium]